MNKVLKPFQKIGAEFLATHPHAILGDEPGLGKTVQAIYAAGKVGARKHLVICPASVRAGWQQEIYECLGMFDTTTWDIVSYNGAVNLARNTKKKWDVIIPDEGHFLKNSDSQRTQAVLGSDHGLIRRGKYKWPLTGTLMLNRPVETYPLLKTLGAHLLKPYDSFGRFTQKFCGAYWDARGLNVKGASNLDELAKILSGIMLRRTIEEVDAEIPPVLAKRVPLQVTEGDLAPLFEVENEIDGRDSLISSAKEDFSQLGDLARLMRATGLAKVRAVAEFTEDRLRTLGKVVVYAWHRDVIEELRKSFEGNGHGVSVYKGGMSDKQKTAAIDRFRDDKACDIFIGNIKAAGTGINGLQHVAHEAEFAEIPWVPADITQPIGRLRRMGQASDRVNVNLLFIPGSIEGAVLGSNDGKTAVIDRVVRNSSSWNSNAVYPSGGVI